MNINRNGKEDSNGMYIADGFIAILRAQFLALYRDREIEGKPCEENLVSLITANDRAYFLEKQSLTTSDLNDKYQKAMTEEDHKEDMKGVRLRNVVDMVRDYLLREYGFTYVAGSTRLESGHYERSVQ